MTTFLRDRILAESPVNGAILIADNEALRKALEELARLLTGPVMHGDGVLPCGGPGGCFIHDAVSLARALLRTED